MIRELKRLEGVIGMLILILVFISPFVLRDFKELFMFIGGSLIVLLILFFQARISLKQAELISLERTPNFHPIKREYSDSKTSVELVSHSRDPIKIHTKAVGCSKDIAGGNEREVILRPNESLTIKFFCKPSKIEFKSWNIFEPELTLELTLNPETGEIVVKK
jgi:hypothetical protein